MEEVSQLAVEIKTLRLELEDLRARIFNGNFVPAFTKKVMWGFIVLTAISILLLSFLSYEVAILLQKVHDIYSLML